MSGSTAAVDPALGPQILALLVEVAPDVDPAAVRPAEDFRQQFDFDSMDVFSFATALHAKFKIDIPERDYRQLASLEKCVAYVAAKLRDRQAPPAALKS
jgi:acyl carrier protein